MATRREFLAGERASLLGGTPISQRKSESERGRERPGYLQGKRTALLKRWSALELERSSWWTHWQEISTFLLPRNGRFMVEDRNRGQRKHNSIYDNTATRSLKIMGAGMMAGATSPARPWFKLQAADPDLNKFHPVKVWLEDVQERMMLVFSKSNTYRSLHNIYEELGAFGTAASIVTPSYERMIHHHTATVGQYAIATDYEGTVTSFFREFERTVGDVVREFGIENVSFNVKNSYENNNLDDWVTILHAIEPRHDRDATKLDDLNMAWRSCYLEKSADEGHDSLLRESGFEKFPVLVPRWATESGDIYGSAPGMESLGDIKGLQHLQLRKAQGIDYQTKPPLQISGELKDRDVDMLPGGRTFVNTPSPQGGIRPAFEANHLRLDFLLNDIEDHRARIRSSFFADLFLMIATASDTTQRTATEIAERHEEKLTMLGPVLERLHNELLEPLVDITFDRMAEVGQLPPPPDEMAGQELNIEFVSMLAQAQKAVGVNSIDRLLVTAGAIADRQPEVLDKLNTDAIINEYADVLGVPPTLIVDDEEVAEVRAARARAQQAAAQMEAAQAGAATMKDMAAADTGGQNALTEAVDLFSGLNSQSGP